MFVVVSIHLSKGNTMNDLNSSNASNNQQVLPWIALESDPPSGDEATKASDDLAREFFDRAWLEGIEPGELGRIVVPALESYTHVGLRQLIISAKQLAPSYGLKFEYLSNTGVTVLRR